MHEDKSILWMHFTWWTLSFGLLRRSLLFSSTRLIQHINKYLSDKNLILVIGQLWNLYEKGAFNNIKKSRTMNYLFKRLNHIWYNHILHFSPYYPNLSAALCLFKQVAFIDLPSSSFNISVFWNWRLTKKSNKIYFKEKALKWE